MAAYETEKGKGESYDLTGDKHSDERDDLMDKIGPHVKALERIANETDIAITVMAATENIASYFAFLETPHASMIQQVVNGIMVETRGQEMPSPPEYERIVMRVIFEQRFNELHREQAEKQAKKAAEDGTLN